MAVSPSSTPCRSAGRGTRSNTRRTSSASMGSSSTSRTVRRLFMGGLRARDLEPERAPRTLLRLDADGAAHPLHRATDERQADAGAARAGRIEALEHPEDALPMRLGDADPVVAHPDAHAIAVDLGADAD